MGNEIAKVTQLPVAQRMDETPRPVAIQNFAEARDLAMDFARSGLFKDAREAEQALVKIAAGLELGVGPVQAMSGIHVIEGKLQMGSGLIASLLRRSGRYDYRVLEHTREVCRVQFLDRGQPAGISEFTIEKARQIGIAGKATWKNYPEAMLFARAISQGARWYAPDVFSGAVYAEGELDDAIDAPAEPVKPRKNSPKVDAPASVTKPLAPSSGPAPAQSASGNGHRNGGAAPSDTPPAAPRPAEDLDADDALDVFMTLFGTWTDEAGRKLSDVVRTGKRDENAPSEVRRDFLKFCTGRLSNDIGAITAAMKAAGVAAGKTATATFGQLRQLALATVKAIPPGSKAGLPAVPETKLASHPGPLADDCPTCDAIDAGAAPFTPHEEHGTVAKAEPIAEGAHPAAADVQDWKE